MESPVIYKKFDRIAILRSNSKSSIVNFAGPPRGCVNVYTKRADRSECHAIKRIGCNL